ncbi:hypothetical protein P8452_77057 [Trifolium repens]|nr:hypothetical protein P8452_77057 [Trifolium repens]
MLMSKSGLKFNIFHYAFYVKTMFVDSRMNCIILTFKPCALKTNMGNCFSSVDHFLRTYLFVASHHPVDHRDQQLGIDIDLVWDPPTKQKGLITSGKSAMTTP